MCCVKSGEILGSEVDKCHIHVVIVVYAKDI